MAQLVNYKLGPFVLLRLVECRSPVLLRYFFTNSSKEQLEKQPLCSNNLHQCVQWCRFISVHTVMAVAASHYLTVITNKSDSIIFLSLLTLKC